MAKEYLVIFDAGDNWKVSDTLIVPDGYETSEEGLWNMQGNEDLFNHIKSRIETHEIYFPKDVDGKLILEDLSEVQFNQLEKYRNDKFRDAKVFLNSRIGIPDIFEFVEFIFLNNSLLEKGYIITDDNRYEKYLEIVETEDDDLIKLLEKFLETRDEISVKMSWFNIYNHFIETTRSASSIKEINDAWKDYIQTFN